MSHDNQVERITTSDPRLSDFANLTDVQWRQHTEHQQGLFIAEGAKVIDRALAAGHTPRVIAGTDRWLPDLERWAQLTTAPVLHVDAATLEEVTGYHVHRGALAAMERPKLPTVHDLATTSQAMVLIEDVVDHANVGAIFRNAAALGADSIVISPRCADPLYRRSIKVSMGTVFHIPWTRSTTWTDDLDYLTQAGFTLAALALDPQAIPLSDFASQQRGKVALVLGTEGEGLSQEALQRSQAVTIPMRHGVDSLNVAAASAIALWEFLGRN